MKSKCCNAPVTVEGQTIQYYVCLDCEKATDPQEEVECSHLWYPYERKDTTRYVQVTEGAGHNSTITYDKALDTEVVTKVFCQKCLKIVELKETT